MELYLKVTGLLPVFWRDNLSITQRIVNGIVLGLNLAYCVAVFIFLSQKTSYNELNFVQRSQFRKVLNYCFPTVVTVAGIAVADRIRKVLCLLHEVDCELKRACCCFVDHGKHRQQIVLYASCYGISAFSLSLFYLYVVPRPIAIVVCNIRYDMCLVAVCNQICIIIWLIWTRFRELNNTLRYSSYD
ncbi:hypothetical protein quinque_000925 [Culex quinquefasciatus]